MAFILHHYPFSPYAEKIRAMLGYTNTTWISCLTSEAPPRKQLEILSGGYSRIPIFQDGADIYCDSNLIADRLAQTTSLPELSAYNLDEDQLALLKFFEEKVFFAAVNMAFDFGFFKRLIKENSLFTVFKLVKDRLGMSRSSKISMGSPKSAPKHINKALSHIKPILDKAEFLGGDKPSILDFGLYHCFWFAIEPGQKALLEADSQVAAWFERMHSFSATPAQSIEIDQALNMARTAEPAAISQEFLSTDLLGETITIQPSDYRCIPVTGELVGESDIKWIIKREHRDVGAIHIHFPKRGYERVS